MPIIDGDGAIVGVITFDDLGRLLVPELDTLAPIVTAGLPSLS